MATSPASLDSPAARITSLVAPIGTQKLCMISLDSSLTKPVIEGVENLFYNFLCNGSGGGVAEGGVFSPPGAVWNSHLFLNNFCFKSVVLVD